VTKWIEIFPENINQRDLQEVTNCLKSGGVAIIPTDSIYAIVADLYHKDAMNKLCRLIGKKPNKANLSILCKDLSNLAKYTNQLPNSVYKAMNRLLPGPFTFVLQAGKEVPRIFRQNKKTIGIRVPDNAITQALIQQLGNPLVSSSIHADDEIQEYLTEPEEIYEVWMNKIDYLVSGGAGTNVGTTVLDATSADISLIREGLGFERL
jgi:tRNA threonylcarbamoyl adenosine modification protein (Sua5/YciO/YrdC/YwlC family)